MLYILYVSFLSIISFIFMQEYKENAMASSSSSMKEEEEEEGKTTNLKLFRRDFVVLMQAQL
jgi:preprotein translocase subunit SecG